MDSEKTEKKPGIFGKIGALWKSGTKGKMICLRSMAMVLLLLTQAACSKSSGGEPEDFNEDEPVSTQSASSKSSGGEGGGDWKYTGEYFDSVFSGFPKNEGVVYQHFPRDIFILSNILVPIKVMQATKKGNLVTLENSDRVVWVETKRRYEDDEPLDEGYYIRRGSMEYTTAFGAEKTVARYVEVTDKKMLEKIEKAKQELEAKEKAEEEAREAQEKAEEDAREAKRKASLKALGGLDVAGTRAGETKTITLPGGVQMEMVWCPPGVFLMGSPKDEDEDEDYFANDTQHQVTLTKGFWMAKTEVTQAQWQSVMGKNPSHNKGDDLPVEQVSWNDCQKFCEKTVLQLPTEAEWEYACRAGSTGDYGGTGSLDDMGWYEGNSGNRTHSVGQKSANAWGLYDMHGNVQEWCEDAFRAYPSDAVTDSRVDEGRDSVLRGGAYSDDASNCRSANRSCSYPRDGYDEYGFRPIARD